MNYYLLSVDDDWIYHENYIKTMINYIEKYKSDSFCLSKKGKIIGNRMIYKSNIFEYDFITKLTDEIINTRISDAYIYHYLKQKKKIIAHHQPKNFNKILERFNSIYPNSGRKNGRYSKAQINKAKKLIEKIQFEK